MKNKETLEDYVLDSDEHNNLKSDDGTYLNFHRQSELLLWRQIENYRRDRFRNISEWQSEW